MKNFLNSYFILDLNLDSINLCKQIQSIPTIAQNISKAFNCLKDDEKAKVTNSLIFILL